MVNVYNENDELIKSIENPYARILLKDNKADVYRKNKKFSIQLKTIKIKEKIMNYKFKKNDIDILLNVELKQDIIYFTTTIEKYNIKIENKLPFLYLEYMYKLSNKMNMGSNLIESTLENFRKDFYDENNFVYIAISKFIDVEFNNNLLNAEIKTIDEFNFVLSFQNDLETNEHYINSYIVNECYNYFLVEIKKSDIDYNKDYTVYISKKFGKNHTESKEVEKDEIQKLKQQLETVSIEFDKLKKDVELNKQYVSECIVQQLNNDMIPEFDKLTKDVEKIKNTEKNETSTEIEFLKCKNDIYYFIDNYIKFEDGGILHEHQKYVLDSILKSNFGTVFQTVYPLGKTTMLAIYSTYFLLFHNKNYKNITFIAYKNNCKKFQDKMIFIIENLPDFLQKLIDLVPKYTNNSSIYSCFKSSEIELNIFNEQQFTTSKKGDEINNLVIESDMLLIDCCNTILSDDRILSYDKNIIVSNNMTTINYIFESPINIKDEYIIYTKTKI